MDRRAVAMVAVAVLAFAIGRFAAPRDGAVDADGTRTAPPDLVPGGPAAPAAASPTTTRPAVDLRPAPPRPATVPDDAPTPTGSVAAATSRTVRLDGLEPARIRVRVLAPDGGPAVGVVVRAIAPGAVRPADEGLPCAETDDVGVATLVVPRPGRYALTAQSGLRVAVAEGVLATADARGEHPMTLARPSTLEVRCVGAPVGAPWSVRATATPPPLGDGTVVLSSLHAELAGNGPMLALGLPDGVPFAVVVEPHWGDPAWRGLQPVGPLAATLSAPSTFVATFEPRVAAPASVGAVTVSLQLRVEATTGELPPSGRVSYTFRHRATGSSWVERGDGFVDWGPEDAGVSLSLQVERWPPTTPGELEWTVGDTTDRIQVPAADAGERVQLAATTRVPRSAIVEGVRGVEVLDVAGTPVLVGGPDEVSANLLTEDDELGYASEADAGANLRSWLRGRVGQSLTAVRGTWLVSRAAPAVGGETVRLRLELGGYLLVHQPKPMPEGLGQLRAERTDGGWLGAHTTESPLPNPTERGDTTPSRADVVANGTLLGPLPPGDVGLRFLLGGVEVGRVTARAVAGEVSVLTIR